MDLEDFRLGYRNDAASATGTLALELFRHVRRTADEVVERNAPADLHASVEGGRDEEDMIRRAGHVERLPLAVLVWVYDKAYIMWRILHGWEMSSTLVSYKMSHLLLPTQRITAAREP